MIHPLKKDVLHEKLILQAISDDRYWVSLRGRAYFYPAVSRAPSAFVSDPLFYVFSKIRLLKLGKKNAQCIHLGIQ